MIKKKTNLRVEITASLPLGSSWSEEEAFDMQKEELRELLDELESRRYVNATKYNLSLLGGITAVVKWDTHLYCEYCEDPLSVLAEECTCVKCGQLICVHCAVPVDTAGRILHCEGCVFP